MSTAVNDTQLSVITIDISVEPFYILCEITHTVVQITVQHVTRLTMLYDYDINKPSVLTAQNTK